MRALAPLCCAAMMIASGAAPAQTAEVQDTARTIEFEISEGGQVVASPTLRIQIGRPAAVSVGAYSLRLRMDRAAAPDGAPAPYLIRSSLYRSGGNGTLLASPSVTVAQGEQARLRFSGSDGSDLSLAVLVR